jgi:hypothetical protein
VRLKQLNVLNQGVQMGCCYFHFCQAIFKKMKEMLYYPAYQRDALKVCRAVRRVFGLAFLPVNRVASTLDEIEVDFNQVDPNLWVQGVQRPDLTAFFTYVRTSYVLPATVAPIAM